MEHLLQKSKCSIFPNIFKHMIFQRHQKALLWSKGLKAVWKLISWHHKKPAVRSGSLLLSIQTILIMKFHHSTGWKSGVDIQINIALDKQNF